MIGDPQLGLRNGCGLRGFDPVLGLRLARACLEAYDPAKADGVVWDAHYDLRARIEEQEDKTIVAFRGTASLENWLVDANALPNSLGLHSGFYLAWLSIRKKLMAAIPANKPVCLTGHSLGGALAVVAARELDNVQSVYTFGQPRVCRPEATMSTAPHFRIVDKEDIVPHVPGLLCGYRHRGDLILFTCIGTVDYNPPVWQQLVMHALGIGADLYRIHTGRLPEWVAIREHEMQRYYNLMATMPASL